MKNEGTEMHGLMRRLYPICRSITGNGVRETLSTLKKQVPIEVREVKTGTKAFDWAVPKEWNIRDAWVKGPSGKKIIDFKESNLHVLNYSAPIHRKMPLAELRKNLFSLPQHPDWIPYLTSYYNERWGFCITHKQLQSLEDGAYEVFIDSSLADGSLTYGELYLPGETDEEFLLSTYLCHPSICNDNLSGVVLLTQLAKHLLKKKRKYSYRLLFIPETIGAIAWLSQNRDNVKKIRHGLVVTCVGDSGCSTYKRSRQGNAAIDRACEHVLKHSGAAYKVMDFWPSGSDERQFCSPGFDLPVGSLMRTPYGMYPEYHTSADNLDFVSAESLADSLGKYLGVIDVVEGNRAYQSQNPYCEPQLGKRGLYALIGGQKEEGVNEMAMFWTLNLSDGKHSMLEIAERANLEFQEIRKAADVLEKHGLIK